MTPYYEHAGITIYHGDCRSLMPVLPDGVVISDPPYNIGYKYESWADNLPQSDYCEMISLTLRAPSVIIHLPESMFLVSGALSEIPEKVVAWVYNAHMGNSWRSIAWFGVIPDFTCERREYNNPEDKRVAKLMESNGVGPRIRDWWHIEQVKGNALEKWTEHHCQIPLAVMKRIINITAHHGPIIDPFCGTGTTLQAARDLGREAIGIEIEEKYCEIAAKRLSQGVLAL